MGWKPHTFWNATFYEISCAYVGHCRYHRIGPWAEGEWTPRDVDEFKAEVEALKERFPDRPMTKAEWRKVKKDWDRDNG